jgi:hypothetical protein
MIRRAGRRAKDVKTPVMNPRIRRGTRRMIQVPSESTDETMSEETGGYGTAHRYALREIAASVTLAETPAGAAS